MGLDIYVGTFHRYYYAGQWETVLQQMAGQGGLEVKILRPQPGLLDRLRSWFRPKRDPVKEIERWKGRLSAAAGVPLGWNEHPEAEYFTDKPGWESYGALLLWAACEERGAASTLARHLVTGEPKSNRIRQIPIGRARRDLGSVEWSSAGRFLFSAAAGLSQLCRRIF